MKVNEIVNAVFFLRTAKVNEISNPSGKLAVSKAFVELKKYADEYYNLIEDAKKRVGEDEAELQKIATELLEEEKPGISQKLDEETFSGLLDSNKDWTLEQIGILSEVLCN